MDSESVYTNDEIAEVAKKVAEKIIDSKACELMRPCLFKAKEWYSGPLAMFIMWSNTFNPLGKFRVEMETLTVPQKKIITTIVGKAMVK